MQWLRYLPGGLVGALGLLCLALAYGYWRQLMQKKEHCTAETQGTVQCGGIHGKSSKNGKNGAGSSKQVLLYEANGQRIQLPVHLGRGFLASLQKGAVQVHYNEKKPQDMYVAGYHDLRWLQFAKLFLLLSVALTFVGVAMLAVAILA